MFKQFAVIVATMAILPTATSAQENPSLLSAFFGLDNSRQIAVRTAFVCQGVSGRDGMPVIFSHEVDPDTLQPDDFRVMRASGDSGRVGCVTLRPADDVGELRTALIVGQYGSPEDPPATVEVVGDVMSLDGTLNFKGTSINVIPLADGPTMILAEDVPPNYWSLGNEGDCPRPGLKGIVRTVWVGGITKPGGDEIDEKEMELYRVSLRRPDGSIVEVTPVAVGDLKDNDNNHELCLDVEGEPMSVMFPAGFLTDPNEDLNPATDVSVLPVRKD